MSIHKMNHDELKDIYSNLILNCNQTDRVNLTDELYCTNITNSMAEHINKSLNEREIIKWRTCLDSPRDGNNLPEACLDLPKNTCKKTACKDIAEFNISIANLFASIIKAVPLNAQLNGLSPDSIHRILAEKKAPGAFINNNHTNAWVYYLHGVVSRVCQISNKGRFEDVLRGALFFKTGFLFLETGLQLGLFLCWRYGSSFSGGLFIDFAFPIFLQRTSFLFCLSYSDVQKCKPDVFFSEILDSQNCVNLLF